MHALRSIVQAACLGLAAVMGTVAAAADIKSMSPADLRALQERLRDAQCYTGAIDVSASAATEAALKRCPVMDPILAIETGMHTAMINRIGVDRDCRLLATGADDKTVRLWSLPEGTPLRTLRLPIGPGDDGKVFAVAVSPDGGLIAAGGWDAAWPIQRQMALYLFDAATGALKGRVGVLPNVVDHLAFSPDGHYLAVTLGDQGMRVIDVQGLKEIAADRDYGSDSYGAAFAPDGRLFTVAYDGFVRAYDRNFRLVKKVATGGGNLPFSVAVDPGGQHVAIGFRDSAKVEIYKASDLSFDFAPNTDGVVNGNLSSLAWSADGQRLIAGGQYRALINNTSTKAVLIWDRAGHGQRQEQIVAADNAIVHLLPCGNGFALGAADPLFAVLDRDGKPRLSKSGVNADMRSKLGDAFQVARDGRQVRFGLGLGDATPVLLDLTRASLSDGATASGLAAPKITGLAATDWQNNLAPKLDGKALKVDQYETSQALAITPDATRFVLGAGFSIRAFNAKGEEQWHKPMPGTAWGVNVTPDGRLVVAAYADGTIRWHRMSDGQELLAMFVHKDDRRWVAWTPAGYYMASPGAEDLIGWHVNRGFGQAADFFPASRFRERFNRPDVVHKVLDTLDEAKAVEEANREANIRTETAPVTSKLPPVIKILSPVEGGVVRSKEVTIEYELRSPSGLPVDAVEILLDGRPTRGLTRSDPQVNGTRRERQVVSIPTRDVEIGLVARSGALASEISKVSLKWGAPAVAAGDDQLKPKLYGVIVGVSTYRDRSLTLKYAAKDARDFAAALQAQKGGLYRDVELNVLTDAQATASAIKDALEGLNKQVTSRDVGVVFLAGHGVQNNRNSYYFLASDSDPNRLLSTAVEGVILREELRSLAGKVLVFLDTCHAGQAMSAGTRGVDINSLVNDLSSAENGVVTYASSTGLEASQENDSWGNGAFTKALLEGLKEKADLNGKGKITTAALDLWLSERVKELTGGSQHPVMIRPSTIADFPVFVTMH